MTFPSQMSLRHTAVINCHAKITEFLLFVGYVCVENIFLLHDYKVFQKPTVIETIRLNRLRWFGHVQRMEGNRIPKKGIIYEFGNNKIER